MSAKDQEVPADAVLGTRKFSRLPMYATAEFKTDQVWRLFLNSLHIQD